MPEQVLSCADVSKDFSVLISCSGIAYLQLIEIYLVFILQLFCVNLSNELLYVMCVGRK